MHKTVAELRLSPEEFAWWQWRIRDEESAAWRDTDRKDWHLAQIAYEIYLLRMSVVGMFTKVKVELTLADFLPAPARRKIPKPRRPRMTRETAAINAKAKWLTAVGYVPPKGP